MGRQLFFIFFLISLSLTLSSPANAQESKKELRTFDFSGESLSEALDRIIQKTDIDLVYDPRLTEGITIYKRITPASTDELLKYILEDHQLDYITLSSGTYVIVKSVRDGPFYGTFAGKIVDSQSGEPLPGATVMLADASGGTSANRSGNFSLNKLLTGKHRIIFSYVGYEPVSKTIEIKPYNNVTERIALNQKPVDVLPVVVEAHRSQMPYHKSGLSGNSDTDWNTVGVIKDAIRDLSFMPGVQYGLSMTDLHLQGGQHSEHRILLDGVPVYNPYSFGHMFSAFSPYAIGGITLHKSGYSVKEGSQIAGLIDLSQDLPATDTKSVLLQGDPLSANLRGDLTFRTGGESSLNMMTALRTNFWDIYKHPTLEQTLQNWNVIDPLITNAIGDLNVDASAYSPFHHDSDMKFFDYHFAAGYDIDDFNSLSASLYLAENAVETHLLNQADNNRYPAAPYLYANDSYAWNNLSTQIRWEQMVTPRFDLSLQTSYSANRFEHFNTMGTTRYPVFYENRGIVQNAAGYLDIGNFVRPLPTQIDENSIRHFIFKTDGSYSFSPRFSLEGGLQFDRVLLGIDISDVAYFPANIDQSSTLLSSYLNNNHSFGNYWTLEWGSRFTYSALSNQLYAEPRFSVQVDKPESNVGYWSVRFSGGLYRQFINENRVTNSGPASVVPDFSIWSLADKEEVPKSWHLNSSFLLAPAESTSLKAELFYKWQPVTHITSYGSLNIVPTQTEAEETSAIRDIGAFTESTKMKVLGGSLRLNQTVGQSKVKLTGGYDYNYSRIAMNFQFGRELPAPWNEPHRVQFRALWRVVPDLAVSAQWQGIWGRTWAFHQSYYNFLRFRPEEMPLPFSFDSPENDRLSPFHQIDLSFIYQPTLGHADLEMRIELVNLLNRKNTLEKYIQPIIHEEANPHYEIRNRHLPGFYPSVSVSVDF